MKKYFLLAFFFFCLHFISYGIEFSSGYNEEIRLKEIEKEPVDSIKVKKLIELVDLYPDDAVRRLKYTTQALEIAEAAGWEKGVGICYYYMAWNYFFMDNQKMTVEYFQKAVDYLEDPMALICSYGFLSNISSWNKNHDKAFEYANKGLQIANQYNNAEFKVNAHLFLGDAYRYNGQRSESNKHYFLSIGLIADENIVAPMEERSPTITNFTHSLANISYLYTLNGFVDSPFYLMKFALSMKSAYDDASVLEKQIYLVSLVKLATAFNLSSKNEIVKQVEIENKEKQTKVYIAGLSVMMLMSLLLVYQNYQRKKVNTQLALLNDKLASTNEELDQANKMKSRFFGILNHDLRRPVAGLISYLELKKKAPDLMDKEKQLAFEQQTIDRTQELLENMENLLFWCKNQMENFTPVFKQISLLKILQDTESFFQYEKRVEKSYVIEEDIYLLTDENYLKTILRNLTLNAVKALENTVNPQIKWTAMQNADSVFITVCNNGPSVPLEKISILFEENETNAIENGLGLIIIRDLAKAIDCKVEFRNEESSDVSFTLIFDKNEKT